MPDVVGGWKRRKSSSSNVLPQWPAGGNNQGNLSLSPNLSPNPGTQNFRLKYDAAVVPSGGAALAGYKIFIDGVHKHTVGTTVLEPGIGNAVMTFTPGQVLQVYVRPYNVDGREGPASNTITVTMPGSDSLAAPAMPTITNPTSTSHTVSVAPVAGATKYEFSRATTEAGVYTVLATPAEPQLAESSLTPDTNYFYKVRAGDATRWSAFSPIKQVKTQPEVVVGEGNVQPWSSKDVHVSYGVCTHPNFYNSVWGAGNGANIDDWGKIVGDANIAYIRCGFSTTHASTGLAVAAAKKYGFKILWVIPSEGSTTPTDQTVAQTTADVNALAANVDYAGVTIGLEGINEPNHNRGGGNPPANWAVIAKDHQQAIWNAAKSTTSRTVNGITFTNAQRLAGVIIVGPSLHDTNADRSYDSANPEGGPQHYHQLADAGILPYQDCAGIHSYDGGQPPTTRMPKRIGYIRSAYGQKDGKPYPGWATECGYTNAVNQTGGFNPVPESVSGTYGPRIPFEFYDMNIKAARYELLNDYNPGKTDVQAHFGMVEVSQQSETLSRDPATWTYKPELTKIKPVLAKLEDPGADYTPGKVNCTVDVGTATDIRWFVTRKRGASGVATFWFYRKSSIYNPSTETHITVANKTITMTDDIGARQLTATSEVQWVDLNLRNGLKPA